MPPNPREDMAISAKQAFAQFLDAAGFKYANLAPEMGGADDSTPDDRIVLMLVGEGCVEFRLAARGSFLFDRAGNLLREP